MFNLLSQFGFGPPAIDGVDFVSADDAKEGMESGKYKAVVDVRTPVEYHTAHIPDSLLASVMNVQGLVDKMSQHKNEEILLYCNTQNSSSLAAKILSNVGFSNINVLSGGISAWSRMGYPIEN